jgi:hypothetical protein
MVKMAITTSLQKVNPSYNKRRVTKRRKRPLENGAISLKAHVKH